MKLPPLPDGARLRLTTVDGVLGGKLWPAAVALIQHLSTVYGDCSYGQTHNLQCLELGAGTGAVGLYAAAAGWFSGGVTVTEHLPPSVSVMTSVPYSVDGMLDMNMEVGVEGENRSSRLLDLLQENIHRNEQVFASSAGMPTVEPLDWTQPSDANMLRSQSQQGQGYDIVLGSDVTYISQLHSDLARTIATTLHSSGTCWISHQERVKSIRASDFQLESFQHELHKEGLRVIDTIPFPIEEESQDSLISWVKTSPEKHNVSILKVQHEEEASKIKTSKGNGENDLWLP